MREDIVFAYMLGFLTIPCLAFIFWLGWQYRMLQWKRLFNKEDEHG